MATAAQKKAAAASKAAANLKASYGFVAMLAQRVPAIGNLMKKAVAQKWTSERFQMEVANTGWWKHTPAAQRQWITQQVADPASASRAMATGANQIAQLAGRLGVSQGMTNGLARSMWLTSQLNGYTDDQLQAYVFNTLSGKQPLDSANGAFGEVINQAREMAASYGYAPPDLEARIRDAASRGLHYGEEGQSGLSQWETNLKNYAKSKYVAFADRIDQGETVKDIAQPYMDTYAQILEVNPQDVGLNDNLIQKWLQGKSEAGKPPAAVPVWQAEQDLRKDPRWGYTNNAKQATAEVANTIAKSFGMIG
jgi:hypothetical protein